MPYKTMITVAAAVGFIFALAFAAAPKFFVLGTFPGAEGLALDVGIYYRYVMAAMIFMVVCVTFQTRNVPMRIIKKQFYWALVLPLL